MFTGGIKAINPLFFVLLAQTVAQVPPTYTIMDYVKVIFTGAGGLLAIYKLGDMKMILYVVGMGLVVTALIMVIPQLEGTPTRQFVLDLFEMIRPLIENQVGVPVSG